MDISTHTVEANGISQRIAEAGTGDLLGRMSAVGHSRHHEHAAMTSGLAQ